MQPGKRLGAYEILQQLGAGGMGEVWLAQDTRLGRKVAIKVLPGEFASDTDRLARFEQEARAAAALNHPHIAAVFDVGAEAGADGTTTHFMVQEYLQGQSLKALIGEGALPLRRALALGAEVAEALRAAHRAGIVHRDLKPDNVFVTDDGHAKVLDFGLAKLTEGPTRGGSASLSPTVVGTAAGVIMGTAGYMAPEQIRGAAVDGRADLFALGCVLQEMVTGCRAFDGADIHEILHRIQRDEPAPLRNAAGPLPARLQAVVARSLSKDPEQRYQCAGDVLVDLRTLLRDADTGTLATPESAPTPAPPAWSPLRAAAVAAAILAVGALAGWMARRPPADEAAPVVRLRRDLPRDAENLPGSISQTYNRVLAMSPDGQHFAVVTANSLFLGSLDQLDQMVPLAEGTVRSPTFSPDGSALAYWNAQTLWRVPVTGGSALAITRMADRPFGLHWGEDGYVYVGRSADGIWRANARGGDELEQVFAPERGEFAHGPQLLPGGEWLLLTLATSRTGWESARIIAVSLRSGERRVILQPGRDARYVATGHLLWVRDGGLFANRFDPGRLEVGGDPVPLASPILTSTDAFTGAAYFGASDNGAIAYIASPSRGSLRPMWDDGSGEPVDAGLQEQTYQEVDVSPDERRIATTVESHHGVSVWIYDVASRGTVGGQDLTPGANSRYPVWSPDSEWVYFATDQDGDTDIWRRRADLSSAAERVYAAPGQQFPGSVSADGRWLAFSEEKPGTSSDIYLLELSGDPVAQPLVTDPSADVLPVFSPDGRFVAYESDEGGDFSILIVELATGRRWTVGEGYGPRWEGRHVYYQASASIRGNVIQQVAVDLTPTVMIGAPVSRGPGYTFAGTRGYDPTAGGRILTLLSDADPDAGDSVIIVLSWPSELPEGTANR